LLFVLRESERGDHFRIADQLRRLLEPLGVVVGLEMHDFDERA
jgi:hypothetical protein